MVRISTVPWAGEGGGRGARGAGLGCAGRSVIEKQSAFVLALVLVEAVLYWSGPSLAPRHRLIFASDAVADDQHRGSHTFKGPAHPLDVHTETIQTSERLSDFRGFRFEFSDLSSNGILNRLKRSRFFEFQAAGVSSLRSGDSIISSWFSCTESSSPAPPGRARPLLGVKRNRPFRNGGSPHSLLPRICHNPVG
jgi:hypothetical protein